MENNRKGNGIFLGIVSIATLIVAIIGATFAYFSATTRSNEDAVNLEAYEFNLSMVVTPVFPDGASKIIPLDPDEALTGTDGGQQINTNNLEYALNKAANGCIDSNDLQVCVLYKVEISNGNTNPITLNGKIRTVSNEAGTGGTNRTPFQNLKYQSVSSTSLDPATERDLVILTAGENLGNGITAVGTKEIAADVGSLEGEDLVTGYTEIDSIYVPAATVEGNVVTPGVGTAFVLIYLDETGDDQSAEMGAKYTGQFIYESGDDAASTLTGTFNLSGA